MIYNNRYKYILFLVILLSIVLKSRIAFANELPIYSVNTKERVCAVTFDAAWGASDVDALIQLLDEYGVKATFFVCGYWVEKYPQEVKKLFEAGHDIANHGDTHAHVASLNYEQNKKEIYDAHIKVKELLGIDMDLYRSPYGEYNDIVLSSAAELGYFTIQWDVDSLDWKKPGAKDILNNVVNNKNLKNGSILLFHNDLSQTLEALPEIFSNLTQKGYNFVPVSQLIYRESYKIDHTGRQIED